MNLKEARERIKAAKGTGSVPLIIAEARRLGTLTTRRRKLLKDLRELDKQIRETRKVLKAIVSANVDPMNQAPPLKAFGEV